MSKQENVNEDVEFHAHIDGGDILNFTYNNLKERWVGFFFLSNL
jgi:hypothetical protein